MVYSDLARAELDPSSARFCPHSRDDSPPYRFDDWSPSLATQGDSNSGRCRTNRECDARLPHLYSHLEVCDVESGHGIFNHRVARPEDGQPTSRSRI